MEWMKICSINLQHFESQKIIIMMHNNGENYFWGMHTGWSIALLVAVVAIAVLANWLRKGNEK